jgi:hypothetical protein
MRSSQFNPFTRSRRRALFPPLSLSAFRHRFDVYFAGYSYIFFFNIFLMASASEKWNTPAVCVIRD